ncbi:GNAT family N-acetyltransferase [Parahaliea mediterranea]|uniref:GNAT family N-acetyltransferase n=1 Tax=Parahaliea mediterranea TaxID=651086 RepID=A0A939DI91_9GAMM|nr:GNAT family N-acetyltransferase [Parahaliea mediterranea]MBN7798769.1 GNAT family N-acetyltransferase [Parahaliea mediterranea]
MLFSEIASADIPLGLLLEADPSTESISSYLPDSWCFAVSQQSDLLGVAVAGMIGPAIAEIYNISVYPEHQGRGIGSDLLKFTLASLADRDVKRVELGTGSFGYQLGYYQRIGFRVDSIIKDHFLSNYSAPIFENGIQHKDMLRLYIDI